MSEPENAPFPSPPAGADDVRRLRRTERVLACYRPVLGHDLPNLLVAIQGLLQILDLEERDRLSGNGRDYLRRLVATTQRAQDMVRLLREVARAGEAPVPAERVPLAELLREVMAETKQLYPGRAIGYDLSIQVPVVVAPRRVLHQALLQVLRHVIPSVVAARRRLDIGSRDTPAGIELWVAAGRPPALPEGTEPAPEKPAANGSNVLEARLGLALVGELADAWGGTFHASSEAGRGTTYTLLVPTA
jgi:signal transduction histidine kinase